jgi:hypothetical protein
MKAKPKVPPRVIKAATEWHEAQLLADAKRYEAELRAAKRLANKLTRRQAESIAKLFPSLLAKRRKST